MWSIFEHTYKLFKAEAIDFLDGQSQWKQLCLAFADAHHRAEMLPSLDNYVSFGGDVFKARPDYRQMVIDIYTTALSSDHLGENDGVNGCKLAESMMLNLRGHVDDVSWIT